MAWDNNRPYAPFLVYKEGTIAYDRGERECMESYAYVTPDEKDIDAIYERRSVSCSELLGRDAYRGVEFRPFKDVELSLTYDGYERGRSAVTFYWRDKENVRYPMFATELDRLIKDGMISNKIGGLWSAEKRGQNYGIRLEKLSWRSASHGTD